MSPSAPASRRSRGFGDRPADGQLRGQRAHAHQHAPASRAGMKPARGCPDASSAASTSRDRLLDVQLQADPRERRGRPDASPRPPAWGACASARRSGHAGEPRGRSRRARRTRSSRRRRRGPHRSSPAASMTSAVGPCSRRGLGRASRTPVGRAVAIALAAVSNLAAAARARRPRPARLRRPRRRSRLRGRPESSARARKLGRPSRARSRRWSGRAASRDRRRRRSRPRLFRCCRCPPPGTLVEQRIAEGARGVVLADPADQQRLVEALPDHVLPEPGEPRVGAAARRAHQLEHRAVELHDLTRARADHEPRTGARARPRPDRRRAPSRRCSCEGRVDHKLALEVHEQVFAARLDAAHHTSGQPPGQRSSRAGAAACESRPGRHPGEQRGFAGLRGGSSPGISWRS